MEEFAGIRGQLGSFRQLDWSIQYAGCGIWKERKVTLAAEGPGVALAVRALHAALSRDRFELLISTGFCGGLDPKLELGAVIVASEVREESSGRRFLPAMPRCQGRMEIGSMLTVNRVAVSAGEKARLRATGARAVEMESAALAEGAEQAGLRFSCFRAVSDTAAEDMPLDFNAYRDSEGRFERGRIARAALASPVRSIPALLRLRGACRLAAAKLGDFFADCQF
jgi:adenosylhomocysteine nucleosidase